MVLINHPRLKATAGNILWPISARLTSKYVRNGSGLILTFHYIGETLLPGVLDSLFLPQGEFERILDFVTRELVPLPPMQFLRRMSENTLPPRATLITFDDCTRDTVAKASPQLLKRNVTALWFACPGLIDDGGTIPVLHILDCCVEAQPGTYKMNFNEQTVNFKISDRNSRVLTYDTLRTLMLQTPSRLHGDFVQRLRATVGLSRAPSLFPLANWDELRALSECGMYIGNHTQLHSSIAVDGIEQFKSDVEAAYMRLQSELSQSDRVFCYPYGRRIDATSSARSCLQQCLTKYAFVSHGGIASMKNGDHLNLHREDASYSLEATKLAPLLALFRSS